MLLLENVRKFYDRREVLSIASLNLERDIYLVKGENGSGKSTFLKIIAGLIPFRGEIRIDGVELKAAPVAYRGAVGWSAAEPRIMSPATVLFRSVVRPFYRENAGTFIFFLTLMLFAVGYLNGAGPVKYHLALILGMLDNYLFLMLVMFCWYLYARKVEGFVLRRIHRPDYEFLSILNTISYHRKISLLLSMQFLLLPIVSLYGLLIIVVAVKHQYFVEAGIVLGFLFFFHIRPAMAYGSAISGENSFAGFFNRLLSRISWLNTSHTGIHLQFIMRKLPGRWSP